MTESVLVTGGTGFIGRHLLQAQQRHGADVSVLTRAAERLGSTVNDGSVRVIVGDLTRLGSLKITDRRIDNVFHLAGYTHAEDDSSALAESLHMNTTVVGTRILLDQVIRAGVRRFIYVSSAKAIGEGGHDCLSEAAPTHPTTAYGRTRLATEQMVLDSGARCGMHVCVLRLPLVYGLGHKGNLARMIEAIANGWFPPLPEVGNRRSMVHVDDVVQALVLAAERPEANGKVYLVTDGRAYSTREIYVLIHRALGKPLPRWTVPVGALRVVARVGDVIGRVHGRPFFFNSVVLDKLLGSACYSSEKLERELGYKPHYTLETTLPEMVREYREKQ